MRRSVPNGYARRVRLEFVGALLVAAVVIGGLVWLLLHRPQVVDATLAGHCRALYGRAATAAESAAVDPYRLSGGREDWGNLTCGALRRPGRL